MRRGLGAIAALLALGIWSIGPARAADIELQEARAQLAPTGKLRAAFLDTNPAIVTVTPGTDEVRGLAGDIARAIAERAGVPLKSRIYQRRPDFENSFGGGEWDVMLNTRNPRQAGWVDYSANFALVELVYLVGPGKNLKEISDIDRKGVRVLTNEYSDAEGLLFGSIKDAQILRVPPQIEPALRLLRSGAADVFVENAEYLSAVASQLPGSRYLPGHLAAIPAAVGVARGRPAALAFVNRVIADGKTSGSIQRSIERAQLHGVTVPP